ncbi:TonB-dependent receptor [Fulvivirga maritima]|uniref:TonB-dependent receptor n=1 Tax=Fulvivirga maritima TaxID=2904247 RepID=UPI001F2B232A|nr:TonB-dependent receptor [Fulvivirga maritima]UII25425.1 TonB-dependent receptor [Fulvivirga maritima]
MLNQIFTSYTGFFSRMDDMDAYKTLYQTSDGYKYVTLGAGYSEDDQLAYRIRATNLLDYFWNQNRNSKEEISNRYMNNATIRYQINDKFFVRGRIGNDYTGAEHETKEYSEVPSSVRYSGTYRIQKGTYNLVYGDILGTYKENLSSDLAMNLSLGATYRDEQYNESTIGTNGGLILENYFNLVNSQRALNGGDQAKTYVKNQYQSAAFGMAEFSYKDYLFVQGTGRYEGRSTLPENENTYFYPSANASFVFSEAFTMPNFMDYGKLRASWGVVANSPEPYAAAVTYNLGSLNGNNSTALFQSPESGTYGNNDIKVEKKYALEFGLETSLFQNKIGLDVTYYNNIITDQILNVATPSSSGASAMLANVGDLTNQGVEIGLNATPFRSQDFRWDIFVNYAYNKNTVKKLMDGIDYINFVDKDGGSLYIRAEEGESIGNIYVLPFLKDADGNKIVDANGFYSLDASADYEKIGNVMPKAVGGINNTLTYKNFSLNVVADYRFGGKMVSTPYLYMKGAGMFESTMQYRDAANGGLAYDIVDGEKVLSQNGHYHDGIILDGVTSEGAQNTQVIDAGSYYMNSFAWGGSGGGAEGQYREAVMDNSFVKLRQASLTYNLPVNISDKVGLRDVQISLVGRNLFYIWKNTPDNWDPEAAIGDSWQAQAMDNAAAAPTRSYGIVLRAKF